MKTSIRLVAICFLALIAFAALSQAASKSVDTEARKYILRGESATYFILNSSSGSLFYVVQIDDKNSLVFDAAVNPITSESVLASVLKEYYEQSGATGFTEASKKELLDDFNQSDVLFNKCHDNFKDLVEDNFFWFQFNCVKLSVGKVCDAEFAQRLRWKTAWDNYRAKVELLKSATTAAEIEIETAGKDARNETLIFDDAGVGYAYFMKYTMDKDPVCSFRYDLVDRVIELSGPAYRNKITDIDSEAREIIRIYNERKDVLKIKEVQSKGKEVLDKAINKTAIISVKFAPIDNKYKEVEAGYDLIKNTTTLEAATNQLNAMNVKYNELAEMIDNPEGLLYAYNKTRFANEDAKKAIEEAAKKYTDTDLRVIELQKELDGAEDELDLVNAKLSNNTEVTTAELQKLQVKFSDIGKRAQTLPSKQNELDLTTTVAIVVLVAAVIGVVVYVLKFRKKGGGGFKEKEMDIRTVMGSGTSKGPLEREKVDTEQHRKAMFPKN